MSVLILRIKLNTEQLVTIKGSQINNWAWVFASFQRQLYVRCTTSKFRHVKQRPTCMPSRWAEPPQEIPACHTPPCCCSDSSLCHTPASIFQHASLPPHPVLLGHVFSQPLKPVANGLHESLLYWQTKERLRREKIGACYHNVQRC